MAKFKKDQIVVATEDRIASCGRLLIRKGAILKVDTSTPDEDKEIWVTTVYDDNKWMKEKHLRAATPEEAALFDQKVSNLDHAVSA
jgi:hypothetical protein